MRFGSILVSVTEGCHVGCAHCGFIGSARDRESNPDEMSDWVRQACDYSIGEIIFTGGEAFECFDVLAAGVAAAQSRDVPSAVFTSSFWGKSFDAALTKLRQLPGLKRLYLSTDVYHQERVPIYRVRNVIEAALYLGIPKIALVITFANELDRRTIRAEYEGYGDRLYYVEDRVIPTKSMTLQALANNAPLLGTAPGDYKCTCHIQTPIINPNGDIFTCHVGKAAAHRDLHELPYWLGTLRKDSFQAIMDRAERRWDYQFLRTHGPRGITQLFERNPELARSIGRSKFTQGCDMCFAVLLHPEGRATLAHHVADPSVREQIQTSRVLAFGEDLID